MKCIVLFMLGYREYEIWVTRMDSNENIKPLTRVAITNSTGASEHIPHLPRLDHNCSIICNEPDQEVVDTKETFAEVLLPAVTEKNKEGQKPAIIRSSTFLSFAVL
jgi:hypothetical protein